MRLIPVVRAAARTLVPELTRSISSAACLSVARLWVRGVIQPWPLATARHVS